MIDPAALGTLRLGLDAMDAEARSAERRRAPARTPRPDIRRSFAALLRRVADLLEPRAVGERRHAA